MLLKALYSKTQKIARAFSALERISEQGGRKRRLIFVPEFSGSAKEKPPLPEKAKAAIWSG